MITATVEPIDLKLGYFGEGVKKWTVRSRFNG
jgi:hypothetical protein